MTYTPLHVHSEYSLRDGLSKCKDIAERTKEIGSKSCALTDHDSVSGAIDFMKNMKEAGLKPILGCEFSICHGESTDRSANNKYCFHQVILAKNLKGWKTILKMVSYSNKDDRFYYHPRLSFNDIKSFDTSDLITFSGHKGSYLADMVEKGFSDLDIANAVYDMKNLFPHFYIEIQLVDHESRPETISIAEKLRHIAKITHTPCIATPNAHYCRREDAVDQRILTCIELKCTIAEAKRSSSSLKHFFYSDNYHIPTYEDMKAFGHTDEELENTNVIDSLCESYNILSPPIPPVFKCPNGMTPDDYLRYLCRQGWKKKLSHITDEQEKKIYGDRVNQELGIFTLRQLSSYFLIVQDIIKYCHKHKYITGPGRGSAAGCMVSYLIDITKINPIPPGLLFERFYNDGRNSPGKISWPDIDIDIPKAARHEVIEYVKKKYGEDNVANIITYTTLKGRSAIKRVAGAVGGISFAEQNAMTEYIPDEAAIADELQEMKEEFGESSIIRWSLENFPDKFKAWVSIDENDEIVGPQSEIFKQAIRLEGTKIIQSRHAAGIVISPQKISDVCPMIRSSDGGQDAGYEGPSCEEAGLLKIDVLGISMLDKVMTIKNILAGVE